MIDCVRPQRDSSCDGCLCYQRSRYTTKRNVTRSYYYTYLVTIKEIYNTTLSITTPY